MTWINTISYAAATGKLRKLYDRVKGPDDNVDNIMMAHSLRPHSMEGHMALYKYVLHHTGNTLPKWFLEALGVYVSALNKCDYCVDHHFGGFKRLLGDDARAEAFLAAAKAGKIADMPLENMEKLAMVYGKLLAQNPSAITETHIIGLRDAGFDDGQILEINQVCAYFCYANRTVLGLGCSTNGDIIGLSPNNSDNPDDWSHT